MIRAILLSELAKLTKGSLVGDDAQFLSVSTDSRKIEKGDLFVALSGPNFDGNSFVKSAMDQQASGALVSKANESLGICQVQVKDTLVALTEVASLNRSLFSGKIVGVTGSCGKTTVKEMIASVLAQAGQVSYTKGNLNNHIGVPLTLLEIEERHGFAVVEMGASAVGEIAHTTGITKPDVAVITNAGEAHLEGFGSRENIVKAKGEILQGLPNDGTAVLNKDDPAYPVWVESLDCQKVISVSRHQPADVQLVSAKLDKQIYQIECRIGSNSLSFGLNALGEHNISNALQAVAVGFALDLPLNSIKRGIESFGSVGGRLMATETEDAVIIDDSYNANPSSTRAGLSVLAERQGQKIAVIGEMAELGADSSRFHAEIGEYAAITGVDVLLAIGEHSIDTVRGFKQNIEKAGMEANKIGLAKNCQTNEQVIKELQSMVFEFREKGMKDKPVIYVKGSRSARMEEIVVAVKSMGEVESC